MKNKFLSILSLVFIGFSSYCQIGPYPGCPGAFGNIKAVQGVKRSDTSSVIKNPGGKVFWEKDTIYILRGLVRVAPRTTLQIAAGTIVMGFPGPLDTSALIIKQGAKLNVLGDVNNPVVMTSCKIQGVRRRGDWGGLVICGNAVTNLGVNQLLEGGYGATYGGTNAEDNSGVIYYLRVEYAGFAFEPNRELNGITLAGVGARTAFRNIQVSYSNDDSFEWFGGSVNGRFLIAHKGLDDDFDTDNGYNGMVQFAIALRDNEVADFSGSNSFESDNDARGDEIGAPVLYPKTSAVFSNVSSYGPLFKKDVVGNKFFKTGALLRRNTEQDIYNSVFVGWPGDTTVNDAVQGGKETGGVFISGANAANNAVMDSIKFKKNVVLQHSTYIQSPATDNVPFFNAHKWFLEPAKYNVHSVAVGTYVPYQAGYIHPEFRLAPSSPLISGSSFPAGTPDGPLNGDLKLGRNMFSVNPALRGFSNVAFRGATNQNYEWAEPWAEYEPNLLKYTSGQVPTRNALTGLSSEINAENANAITISPNPAVLNTKIKFSLEYGTTDASLSVLNVSGIIMHAETIIGGKNEIELNTSGFNPGTYFVRLVANGTVAKTAKLNVVR